MKWLNQFLTFFRRLETVATQAELNTVHDRLQAELGALLQHAQDAAARDAALLHLAGQIPGLQRQIEELKAALSTASVTFDTASLEQFIARVDETVQGIGRQQENGGGATGDTTGDDSSDGGEDPGTTGAP